MKVLKKLWLLFRLVICPIVVVWSIYFIFHGANSVMFTSELVATKDYCINMIVHFGTLMVCFMAFKEALAEVRNKPESRYV